VLMIWLVAPVFALGCWAGWWWAQRRIDHRWYCGGYHPASNPCQPKPEYIERSRRIQENLRLADELEEKAESLRRSPSLGQK